MDKRARSRRMQSVLPGSEHSNATQLCGSPSSPPPSHRHLNQTSIRGSPPTSLHEPQKDAGPITVACNSTLICVFLLAHLW